MFGLLGDNFFALLYWYTYITANPVCVSLILFGIIET